MSEATSYVLDTAALARAVEAITRHRHISMRQVAAETGLSPSTLTRLSQGQKPDADALVTLLAWLGWAAEPIFARRRLSLEAAMPP